MSHLLWYPGQEVLLPDIVRAENCSLYDAEGRRYVDLESGVWCTAIGHGQPRVLAALVAQAGRISHTGFNFSSPVVEEAAQALLALLGFGDGRCTFLCSGSEAVEYGVRTAQAVMGRRLLMTMADSYCGAYGSASRKEESEWYTFDWTACAACPEDRECDGGCPHWEAIPFEQIGAFLLEPGSSSGLVRFPPRKLIGSIADRVRGNGGLVLVNEVTTGMGRTGRWFGFEHYGIRPDIVALGKGIGNGYPVSVAAMAPGVVARMGGEPIRYAQSHQNDPLGAAVARTVVEVIQEEGLIERGREIGARLLAGLEGIQARRGGIAEIRARGLMVALELEDGPEAEFTTRVHRALAERGYLSSRRAGLNVLRVDPSLTIELEDIDGFLAALEGVLSD